MQSFERAWWREQTKSGQRVDRLAWSAGVVVACAIGCGATIAAALLLKFAPWIQ